MRSYGGVFWGRHRRPRLYAGLYTRTPDGGAVGINYRSRFWFKQPFRRRGRPSVAARVALAVLLVAVIALIALT